jgi:hypothetical protein
MVMRFGGTGCARAIAGTLSHVCWNLGTGEALVVEETRQAAGHHHRERETGLALGRGSEV